MSRSKNHDNSVELSRAMAGEDNPYLHSVANEQPKPQTHGGSEQDEEAEQEEALQRAEDEKKRKRRRHRWFALAFILTLLFASVGLAVVLYLRQSTRVTYGQAAHRPGVLPPPPNGSGSTTRDSGHEQALRALERLNAAGHAPVFERRIPSQNSASQNVTTATNESQQPFTLPNSSTATNDAGSSEKNSSARSSTPTEHPAIRSQRNFETSIYAGNRTEEGNKPIARSPERALSKQDAPRDTKTEVAVMAPPFGSILPVRAIGGLYTLRSGALARFELTRDMSGTGWSMKRGTILVGTTKGGEYDRAYVSIIGFIDSQSSKLVKLGGDLLGGDGAAGLKGRSRQVDSRWTRVLGQIGNAALNLTGALLGGRSNGSVIISDGARLPLMNPISDELSGVIGSPSDGNRRSQFVEVVAGTPGYVMVTDLPAEIMPANANELNQQTMTSLADIDATRPATGISEREFADLLANGSSDEIKARLHRMSPEMRKIALAVIE